MTVNLGLRYELWSPIDERFGRQANFDLQTLTLYIPKGPNQDSPLPPNFATAFPTIKVSRGQVPSTLIPWDKFDFGPRLGIAYQVMDKTVIRIGFGMFYGGEENQGGSPNRGEGVPFNETVNLVRANGVSSFVGVSQPQCTGCNYFPNGLVSGYPLNVFTLPAPVSFRGVQSDFRNPLVQKWNFVIQRELPGNMALEVGYEGNHQAHQVILWNSDPSANIGTTNSAITGETQREILPPANCPSCASIGSGLSMTSSFGYGNYSALSTKLEKRFSHGLQFLMAYVWSHALANSGTPLSGSGGLGTPDPTNFASEYSSASWDIRHNFTSAFTYDVPFGKGKAFGGNMNRLADTIAGNWHLNGILTLRTGVPYTLRYNGCQGVWGACRAGCGFRCQPQCRARRRPRPQPLVQHQQRGRSRGPDRRQPRPPEPDWSSDPNVGFLRVQGFRDHRALQGAVPRGIFQHRQHPGIQHARQQPARREVAGRQRKLRQDHRNGSRHANVTFNSRCGCTSDDTLKLV